MILIGFRDTNDFVNLGINKSLKSKIWRGTRAELEGTFLRKIVGRKFMYLRFYKCFGIEKSLYWSEMSKYECFND